MQSGLLSSSQRGLTCSRGSTMRFQLRRTLPLLLLALLFGFGLAGCDKSKEAESSEKAEAGPATLDSACDNLSEVMGPKYTKEMCVEAWGEAAKECATGQEMLDCFAAAKDPVAVGDCHFICRE